MLQFHCMVLLPICLLVVLMCVISVEISSKCVIYFAMHTKSLGLFSAQKTAIEFYFCLHRMRGEKTHRTNTLLVTTCFVHSCWVDSTKCIALYDCTFECIVSAVCWRIHKLLLMSTFFFFFSLVVVMLHSACSTARPKDFSLSLCVCMYVCSFA